MKRYPVHRLLIILLISLYLTGCGNNSYPIQVSSITSTVTLGKTPEVFSTATISPTLTPTPLPTFTLAPTITPTPLAKGIFDPFPGYFYNNTVKTKFGIISAGDTFKEQIYVDNTLGDIHFLLAWEVGVLLDLSLSQPDGTILDLSTEMTEDFTHAFWGKYVEYIIDQPQLGTWTVMVSNRNSMDVPYKLEAYSTADPMNVVLLFDDEYKYIYHLKYDEKHYVSGDCMKLTAWFEDLISLTARKFYVHGANVQVTVKDPVNNEYSFNLYDYGLHGDQKADDGIYANYFCNTQAVGQYLFYMQASGITNWNGGYGVGNLPFTREFIRWTTVH